MTNIYKKHAKALEKGAKKNRLWLQRSDNTYYITDGCSMLKVPASVYDYYIRPVSPIFIPLEDGQKSVKSVCDVLPVLSDDGLDPKEIFETYSKNTASCRLTKFIVDTKDSVDCCIAIVNKKPVAYNRVWMEAIFDYATPNLIRASDMRWPAMVYDNAEAGVGAVIMPCRVPELASDISALYTEVQA